jgi:hypothetical protein
LTRTNLADYRSRRMTDLDPARYEIKPKAEPDRRRLKIFPGVIFLAIGGILLSISAVTASSTRDFLKEAVVADGVVTALVAGPSHPDIQFRTVTGETITYSQGGWIGGYKEGQRVRIFYLPEDPHGSACVDDPGALWFVSGGTGLLGVAQLLGGLFALLRRR